MEPIISEGSFESTKNEYHLVCLAIESSKSYCITKGMGVMRVCGRYTSKAVAVTSTKPLPCTNL